MFCTAFVLLQLCLNQILGYGEEKYSFQYKIRGNHVFGVGIEVVVVRNLCVDVTGYGRIEDKGAMALG